MPTASSTSVSTAATSPSLSAKAAPPPLSKDSMKSTWRGDKTQWKLAHKVFNAANAFHNDLDRPVPVHAKTDKVPYMSDLGMHRWILVHACTPMLLHQLFVYTTGINFNHVAAYFFYYFALRMFMTRQARNFREMGHTYGFLDGDVHERDDVPDVGVAKALVSVLLGGIIRPMLTIFLTYDPTKAPFDLNWGWIFVELCLYGVILDFWFYWYHRIMHDVKPLWKFHRTHHLTKHPNPLLSIYADSEQEFMDVVGIPLLTYGTMKLMGMPMGFYEWHLCMLYVFFSEAAGHSGLRVQLTAPNPLTWLMRIFDMDLVIEDHDLHHRKGWRKSHNYGKQTRVWDRLFGTCTDRLECLADNIDYDNMVVMKVF